ncbi:hypothetical protein K469DRAFT_775615 [Zopfia rhizophila CBS 207.26]|uniref:Uncharacterized protein n=1 Tax=Zopfia rhizophila CBS 207.26 TaxID=1314779 RepID=A0A6A6E463_9PEZI|nr:hypothetical protein K469DRAFT_775615 [Zopfia rhizophila CBS 207.26]
MFSAPLYGGRGWNLILSVYWNSAEPLAAWCNLTVHVARMSRYKVKDKSIGLGAGLSLLSLLIAASSIIAGIFVPSSMVLRNLAPANPESVWVPLVGELSSMSGRYAILRSAAAIRAIGSAEASRVTMRNRVKVRQQFTLQSTPEMPDFAIEYSYNLTGVEFGLRHDLGLLHSVQGRCVSEYGWLNHSMPDMDNYVLWDHSNYSFPVPSSNHSGISKSLDLVPAIYPPHVEETPSNISYALVYVTAHLPTATASDDAMYKTEKMPDDEGWDNLYPFRVRAERPVLSCWQKSNLCVKAHCTDPLGLANYTNVPAGIRMILSGLQAPMLLSMASRAGPSTLMSFYGPIPGKTIDAGSSSVFTDMERMVLAAYLQTRNIFRDATMMEEEKGFKNAMLDNAGNYLPGSGDFVLESGSVSALSLQIMIAVPAAAFVALALGCCLRMLSREGRSRYIGRRLTILSLPHLYRLAIEPVEDENDLKWNETDKLRPVPEPTKEGYDVGVQLFSLN